MNRMPTRSAQLVVTVGIALLGLLGSPTLASAATTPDTCDSVPKYYCVHVDHDFGAGVVTVHNRWYEGAIDGGAKRWQRYWVADYSWNGVGWSTVRSWGSGNWYTDVHLNHPNGHWEAVGGDTITQPAVVMVRLRYQESTASGSYYWCSSQLEHHLEDNSSFAWGTSQC